MTDPGLGHPILKWLSQKTSPEDHYELLGRPRFDPDMQGIAAAVQSAHRALHAYQDHADAAVAERALQILQELGRIAHLLNEGARWRHHDREVLAALATECRRRYPRGNEAPDPDSVQQWLLNEKHVHPARVGAVTAVIMSAVFARSDPRSDRPRAGATANADAAPAHRVVLDWGEGPRSAVDLRPFEIELAELAIRTARESAPQNSEARRRAGPTTSKPADPSGPRDTATPPDELA
jgi:hypothetical protein